MGKPDEAIELHKKAMRLSPFPPAYYYLNLGNAYMTADRYEEAIKEFKKTLHLTLKNFFAFEGLSICYGLLGQEDKSRAAATEMIKLNSNLTTKSLKKLPYKNRDMLQRWSVVLHKAGVPD